MAVNCYRLPVLVAALLVWGCSRGGESKEAIRQGVIEHLSSRAGLSVAAMQIDVVSVNFRQNEADAVISFRPKKGGEGMQMNYTLERKGNRWVVKGRSGSGANPHGGNMMPMPATPQSHAGSGGLPPGHPPIGKSAPSGTPK
jgi:hypothetical protein